ncbi:unnamed protein product [Paramecium octaurelia]|uniref:Uncharacterized protein n=1 Tax=Paramecium octaurelia TaxID=43137 RepID=A0A8S1W233_PAROT|nr:unnamed protein product [Paramecium octaurelia]
MIIDWIREENSYKQMYELNNFIKKGNCDSKEPQSGMNYNKS